MAVSALCACGITYWDANSAPFFIPSDTDNRKKIAEVAPEALGQLKILLVEDDRVIIKVIRQIAKKILGVEAVFVERYGDKALQRLEKEMVAEKPSFTTILLDRNLQQDWDMREDLPMAGKPLRGDEVFKRICDFERKRGVRFHVVWTSSEPDSLNHARMLKTDGHLKKEGIDAKQFFNVVYHFNFCEGRIHFLQPRPEEISHAGKSC